MYKMKLIYSLLYLTIFADFYSAMNVKYDVRPVSIDASDLGEGPHWDEKRQELFQVDINNYEVCKLNVTSEHRECFRLNDLLTLVIPYQSSDDILVTQRNNLVQLNWNTKKWDVIGVVAEEMNGNERFNDGKIDAKGRFWGGTLTQESVDPRSKVLIGKGSLYKFENGKFIKMSDGFTLTNGMTWSHDNKKMYVNDSDGRKIYIFDFDLEKGTICEYNKE